MTTNETPGDGKNHLFRDSKFGVIITAALAIGIDGVLDGLITGLTSVDLTGWPGWLTTAASGVIAGVIGLITAYKAKRRAHAGGL